MTVPALADHLVIATPDLDSAVDALTDQIGVRPSPGGKHPGIATQNHLLSLSDSCYLEVIGPDPSQPAPDFPRPFGIDDLTEAKLVTWAIHVTDLEGRIESARAGGYDPGEIMPLSRQSPDGLLEWRLTTRPERAAGGIVPFLIDWGQTPSPALASAKGCSLLDLRAEHPDPDEVPLVRPRRCRRRRGLCRGRCPPPAAGRRRHPRPGPAHAGGHRALVVIHAQGS